MSQVIPPIPLIPSPIQSKRWMTMAYLLVVSLLPSFAYGQDLPSGIPVEQSSPKSSLKILEVTYEQAIALARKQSPAFVAAKLRGNEAENRVEAASVRKFNPQLSGSIGPRFASSSGTTVDGSIGARQWIETGGERRLRIKVAKMGSHAERERIEDAERELVRAVSLGFISALYWQRRLLLAEENIRIHEAIAKIAARRHEVGDLGGLEVSVSALALVRTRSEWDRVKAELTHVYGQLKVWLGGAASSEILCRGDLRQFGMKDSISTDVASVSTRVKDRPDLRALRAEVRQAEAEVELGRAHRAPNLALGAVYSREESANIVQGTLRIAIPVFDHGQGASAVAQARRKRLRAELDAIHSAAAIESNTALAVAKRLGVAVRGFEEGGLKTLERVEHLATASYKQGAIPLGELLALRRELVEAKLDYVDLLLGAATARAEFEASIGTNIGSDPRTNR